MCNKNSYTVNTVFFETWCFSQKESYYYIYIIILKNIADKTLSQNLKELEKDDLIVRTVYPQIPPKVEYTLTERGQSLVRVLDKLCDWGMENRPKGEA
ncbi:MAG: helix-turn-helix transcriptional regulator [Prevotella sp.]|nr:helix-turn-helix transcriptional regulator [Prevotella sp.]